MKKTVARKSVSAKKVAGGTKKSVASKASTSKKIAKPVSEKAAPKKNAIGAPKAAAKKAVAARKPTSEEPAPMSALGFFIQTYSRI